MSNVIRRLGLPLVLALVAAAPLHAAGGVELRWNFRKGQTFKYLMKHHEVRTITAGDEKRETTTDFEFDWRWTVQEIDDAGAATLGVTMAGLTASIKGYNYQLQYDSSGTNSSEDPDTKSAFRYFDQLRLGKYRLRLARDGRVLEFRGLDAVIADLPAEDHAADWHGQGLRDDTFAWYLQQALGVLPATKVAQGGTWQEPVKTKLAGYGEMTGQTDYRLDKPAKTDDVPCQVLRFTGSYALDLDMRLAGLALAGPLKITKAEGAVRFDSKAAAVHDSEYKTAMSGELKIGDSGSTMKVGYEQTVTWKVQP